MTTMTALQFHEHLAATVRERPEIRRHDGMPIGAVAHQGDTYTHRIAALLPAWDRVTTGRQVAVGDTIGSRHIAEGDGIAVHWPTDRAAALRQCPIRDFVRMLGVPEETAALLLGPMVVAPSAWTLTHPEHAHHVMPAGVYLVTYQLDRRTMRVVMD